MLKCASSLTNSVLNITYAPCGVDPCERGLTAGVWCYVGVAGYGGESKGGSYREGGCDCREVYERGS